MPTSCIGDDGEISPSPMPFPSLPGYGVIAGSVDHHRANLLYLVKFDIENDDPQILFVDSVLSRFSIEPCDTNAIAFISYDTATGCDCLVVAELSPSYCRDTIWTSCNPKRSRQRIATLFSFRRIDSLFVFAEYADDERAGPWQVMVARIRPSAEIDTIAIIENASHPRLSPDGTEIFLRRFNFLPGEEQFRYGISVYDLLGDSLITPVDGQMFSAYAYRLSRDAPLFYLRSGYQEGNTWQSNVYRWRPTAGEEQMTFLPWYKTVIRYQLVADSLIYHVIERGAEEDEERLAIRLGDIDPDH